MLMQISIARSPSSSCEQRSAHFLCLLPAAPAEEEEEEDSLEILSIQRLREFRILIPGCIDSKESALPFPRSIL